MGTCFLALATTGEIAHGQSAAPPLVISPARVNFDQQAVGSQSQPMTVTISNPTHATIKLEDILLSGMDFSEKTDCAQSLAPTASCTIHMFFKPVIPGPRIGNLDITASDSGSPHFVAVIGTGK
jgi:Abnormal spindle-like microcephaly-assoc'd, ASPM-SPD-2-Hydin